MKGTRNCVTSAMRVMPPRITTAVSATMTTPLTAGAMPKLAFSDSATLLAWTMFPIPKAASAVSRANSVPSQGRPRPFLRMYMAPPRQVPRSSFSR
jgi:hypothetical protein